MAAVITELDRAARLTSKLAVELEHVKRELRRVKNQVRPTKAERIIERAYADAKTLLMLRQSGFEPSRRWLDEAGLISGWRYGWALAILRYARLEHVEPADLVHLELCVKRLDTATAKLLDLAPRDAMITMRGLAGKRYLHTTRLFRGR